ncbi:MAG TPA: hypothetical protein VE958_00360 [Bryobacteraceae bacterium]|jgi:uncharacterized membrane protein|nr:hypothetical protein [Bryobacteraceae bacterium]
MKIDKRSKLGRFMEHVMPGVVRPLRVLWHEIIGFIFIVLAVIFGSSAVRNYHLLQTEEISILRLAVSFFLPLLMAYFGITSFLRARRISRS